MNVLVKGEHEHRLELSWLFKGWMKADSTTENRSLVICLHTSRWRVDFAVASPSGYGLDGGVRHSKVLPQICKSHTS